ncbi:MAG TPA: energy-coupling factor transporter transmembrane protein EcfT, partial [Candidatus Mediterraneibacter norfolkensis]|nr:energy-coupling factor transporter transmembrane protein EcfT [Candidatus Mediterraneibacter norfolkensis]
FISMYGIHGAMAPIIDKTSDPVMFEIFGINYYAKGFAYASRYYFRVAPLMCSLFLIFLTMDVADLGAVMCKAGIPYRFVFTFIDSFQVITLLNKDMEQIRDAQRARGLNTEGNLIQRFKAFVPIMVPVVANSIVKVQDQAIAMETKGFNSKCSKTVYREIEYCKGDYVVKAVGLILAVLAVGYKICTAAGVIPSFFSNII